MKRMKHFALSLLMAVALFSCGEDYDDTALKNEIDDLKSRVDKQEDWCDNVNGQISALQGLVSAMEQNDYITGVTSITEGTKESGYIITFAKSDPITIRHGKDGTNGADGAAGNDGVTPIIGVKQDTDGNYYWTIKTGSGAPVWMTDAEGNKIRTTGNDAVATKPVISVDADTDGKLYWKIDGEWLLDEENQKVPATGDKGDKGDKGDPGAIGDKGDKGDKGDTGPAGEKGAQGDAVFKKDGVDLSDLNYVTFTLADGTTFTVPRLVAMSIGENGLFNYSSTNNVVFITLPANFTQDDYASIMAEVKSSYGTSVDIKTRAAGNASDPRWKVEVTAPTFDSSGKYEENSAMVTLTASADVVTDETAWLEVSILDTQGKRSTAACAIKVKGGTISGDINMTNKSVNEVQAAIQTALAAGITELKLTGPITNSGIGVNGGTFWENTQITKIDLTGVTDWEAVDYWDDADKGDEVIGLPAYAFYGCTSLTEINLPAAVKAIGAVACNGCTALTAINLGEVTHVGKQAFHDCGKLASVDLAKATTLYAGAFAQSGLTAVDLPEASAINVGHVGFTDGSFYSCTQLVSIKAPKLKNTGDGTFTGCPLLATVDMPTLEDIGEKAFKGCTSLSTGTFNGVKTVGEEAFLGCTSLTEMNLPAATTVGGSVFESCTALKTLNLPAATVFDNYLVSGCSNLTKITVTAAGAFKTFDGESIAAITVFNNFSDTPLFVPGSCALVLNKDKQQGGSGSPTVSGNSWAHATWKSIFYAE